MRVTKLNFSKNLLTGEVDTSITLDSGLVLKITDEQFAKLMTEPTDTSGPKLRKYSIENEAELVEIADKTYKQNKKPIKLKKSVDEFGFEEG